jgi:uncharacterized membrane protein (DUF373 family)
MNALYKTWKEKILHLFHQFEIIITLVLSVILGLIIIVSLLRIVSDLFHLFLADLDSLQEIVFADYQSLFGKILTLLISIEFLNSTIKVLKSKDIKTLTLDIVLIAALAISRKLIIYDYSDMEPAKTITLGGLLLCIGLFYFLLRFNSSKPVVENEHL